MKATQLKFMAGGLGLLLALIALVSLVFSCKVESSPASDSIQETKTWTVTVDADGGEGVETSYPVKDGNTLDIPAPTKDHYVFVGWSTSKGGSVNFLPNNTTVTADTPIYAIWKLQSFTVTIDPNGGTVTQTQYTDIAYNTSFNITEPPKAAETYQTGIKEYRDQDGNVFVPGTTHILKPTTLKTIWNVDLKIIRDILSGGDSTGKEWRWDSQSDVKLKFTFTATDQSSFEINSDNSLLLDPTKYLSSVDPANYPKKATLVISSDISCIAQFNPGIEITNSVNCIQAISGTKTGSSIKATFSDAGLNKVFTRL